MNLERLRRVMADYKIDAYLIPTEDPHGSEYVGAHFACREYVSGFTGSAGTLLVFQGWAGLWTDGRYFLQAEEQLKDTGIRLMKINEPGVPTVEQFLRSSMKDGQVLGYDGRCVNARRGRLLHTLMQRAGAKVNDQLDLVGVIWNDRPPRSAEPARLLEDEYAGLPRKNKLEQVRNALRGGGSEVLLLTALEDICWLLNIRGGDIPCTPVVLSYLALTPEECVLFAAEEAFSNEVLDALEEDGVTLAPYESFYDYANRLTEGRRVQLDSRRANARLLTSIPSAVKVIDRPNPTIALKAVKNPTELAGFRRAHLQDGIALTKFMYRLKTGNGGTPLTEITAAELLEGFRREQPDYLQPSFEPIMAWEAHSAVVHYSATPESAADIGTDGFLLADTGGHYRCGTTDCTRTYALGEVSEQRKQHYTAVLRGNLNLAAFTFRAGTTGPQLDPIARGPLWELGLDFNHGTGHGVGHILGVHEGPQNIGRTVPPGGAAAFEPGMVTSDEPGLYLDHQYGIRLENLTACVEKQRTAHGQFLGFEVLTLTPFDRDAIEPAQMSPRELALLNAYHKRVYDEIGPHLDEDERAWLAEATAPMGQ